MYIDGINHVTLKVRDLNLSEDFYTKVLGLKQVGQRPHMRFFSSGRHAHELALLHAPGYQHSGNSGLVHLCFNVPSESSLRALYKHCQTLGIPTSDGVDHTIMHSFYLRDPDAYIIEIGVDRPVGEWELNSQAFAKDYSLDLEADTGKDAI